jgi:hemerythrin superfamily protein
MATRSRRTNGRKRANAGAARGRGTRASGRQGSGRQASGRQTSSRQSAGGRSAGGRSAGGRSAGRQASRRQASSQSARQDAISLLKSDHRQVEDWFEQFEKTRGDERKRDLAGRICAALKAHTAIEEEIFYPAFLEATGDTEMHHEAEIEHEGAKRLIAEIEGSGPDDDYYDARVSVLKEMIRHHVQEEEKRDGMFAKARSADMDLESIGQRLRARKEELMGEESSAGDRGSLLSSLSRLSSSRDAEARR